MRSPKYPLEPLAQLRDRAVDDAARAQAAAVRQRESAEGVRRAAESQRRKHDEAALHVGAAERTALDRGELRAGDLARGAAWNTRVAAEQGALVAAVDQARHKETQARDAERTAQARVASRKADAELVAKDRARWQEARRGDLEAREEEALSEACRPKR